MPRAAVPLSMPPLAKLHQIQVNYFTVPMDELRASGVYSIGGDSVCGVGRLAHELQIYRGPHIHNFRIRWGCRLVWLSRPRW